MKIARTNRFLAAAVVFMAAAAAAVTATAADAAPSMALRRIMREMGQDMADVAGAIAREDWKQVAAHARSVADHAQPPLGEKARILAFAGARVGAFKDHDQRTKAAARQLRAAAVREDGLAVIAAFTELQTSCFACHRQFRQSFRGHFYEQR